MRYPDSAGGNTLGVRVGTPTFRSGIGFSAGNGTGWLDAGKEMVGGFAGASVGRAGGVTGGFGAGIGGRLSLGSFMGGRGVEPGWPGNGIAILEGRFAPIPVAPPGKLRVGGRLIFGAEIGETMSLSSEI